jgi:hypothetical protein
LGRVALALAGLLVSAAGVVLVPSSPVWADAAGVGGDFVPVPATHLLDTRSGLGGTAGVRGAGSTTTFQVLGVSGIPSADVSGLVVDVTAVGPTALTQLTVWPDGSTRPSTSNLSAVAGSVLSTTAVVPVGASGKLSVYNAAGSTHIIVDVQGYFRTVSGAPGQGGFVPVTPERLVDTRSGLGAPKAPLPANGTVTVTIGDGSPVPVIASAFLNVTVFGASGAGWLSLCPSGETSCGSGMDYPAGTTSVGMPVKLGPDGKISLKSNIAINVVIDVEGYFAAQPDQGAGLRTLSAVRLLDTTATNSPIPASGTVDVAIGGTNGLPTRAVAGAVLNLTAVTPAGSGYVGAWPAGAIEPPISLTAFTAPTTRAGIAIVKLGVEGKVRIKNNSGSPLHLQVDLQGWFADPLPAVPIVANARTSAMQLTPSGGATLGAVEYSYVDNLGRLRSGHQVNPDQFGTVQWTTLSGGEAFTGQPALSQLSDGRVQIAAQHTDSNIRSIGQTTVGGAAWNAWASLGGSMASPPVAGRLPDGTTVLFAVDVDGRLWDYRQVGASLFWRSLGDADLTGGFGVVPLSNGLRIVAVNTSGAVLTAAYSTGGTLSSWISLGGSGFTGTPALVQYPGYLTGIVVRGADGVLQGKREDLSTGFPAAWSPVGDLVTVGSPAVILDPLYGRTAVVARGTDNTLSYIWETAPASKVWGPWTSLASGPVVTDPSITLYTTTSGESWLITARNVNGVVLYWLRADPPPGSPVAAGARWGVPFVSGALPKPPDAE